MVVKMMRWASWPPFSSRKFEATIVVKNLKPIGQDDGNYDDHDQQMEKKMGNLRNLVVEVKWKGEKGIALRPLRRKSTSVKRDLTKECCVLSTGFEWNEEFSNVCCFSGGSKAGLFLPWEVSLTVFNGFSEGSENNLQATGTAVLNLTEFVSTAIGKELQIDLPLVVPGATPSLLLHISVGLKELRAQGLPRSMVPVERTISCLPSLGKPDELTGLRARLRNVRLLQGGKKKDSSGEESNDASHKSFYSDGDSFRIDEPERELETRTNSFKLSLNYATLAYTNFAEGSALTNMMSDGEGEEWSEWIYFNNWKLDAGSGSFQSEESTPSIHELQQPLKERLKSRLLPWRKRKVGFGSSSKAKVKGEPLLKKYYGEEGGDDIDFDRRQLSSSSSEDSSFWGSKSEDCSTTSRSSFSEFGDDSFSVGSWELKEVTSRDGKMKLQALVFFASIDQRHERAAGESACTALVAIIANWLQSNQYEVPIKSEFDGLIRDGSLQWRNLCENKEYMERFPDKHFDLETVLDAKICPLSVVPEKSFIGFFHPEGLEGGAQDLDFLHGAMSFDSIWEEISSNNDKSAVSGEPLVYIVSWNDHFFILKVDQDAYYIIDTLGERLFEGCNQAYVLKFDKDATIKLVPEKTKASDEKSAKGKVKKVKSNSGSCRGKRAEQGTVSPNGSDSDEVEERSVCQGKEACKEYIKSFLAAIPIRELQADMKKGLVASSTPVHHRLQVEFHYTQLRTTQAAAAVEFASNVANSVDASSNSIGSTDCDQVQTSLPLDVVGENNVVSGGELKELC